MTLEQKVDICLRYIASQDTRNSSLKETELICEAMDALEA